MKQKKQSNYTKEEQPFNSNESNNLLDAFFEFRSFKQIENEGGYYREFEEEYESYNSDYDLNIK